MLDKQLTISEFVSRLQDGMTIGIGGWATRRKPMTLIRAIARSHLKDLTIVSFGGPDVGILAAKKKIKKLIFGFVSLDHFPLDPHFRAARQAGALEIMELDEGMVHWGLRAAAMQLPFLPTRTGLATDIAAQDGLKTIRSPYADGETLLAMPALKLDAAILHVHKADLAGNTLIFSPDPFFDELMARAASQVFVSTESLVSTHKLNMATNARFNPFERILVSGVIEARFGAHPTAATPDYGIDMDHLTRYIESTSPEGWDKYSKTFIDVDPEQYIEAVGGSSHVATLPNPIY